MRKRRRCRPVSVRAQAEVSCRSGRLLSRRLADICDSGTLCRLPSTAASLMVDAGGLGEGGGPLFPGQPHLPRLPTWQPADTPPGSSNPGPTRGAVKKPDTWAYCRQPVLPGPRGDGHLQGECSRFPTPRKPLTAWALEAGGGDHTPGLRFRKVGLVQPPGEESGMTGREPGAWAGVGGGLGGGDAWGPKSRTEFRWKRKAASAPPPAVLQRPRAVSPRDWAAV